MGKVLFSQVSVCSHQGGTPSPSHNISIHWSNVLSRRYPHPWSHVPSQGNGGTPIQSLMGRGVFQPGQDGVSLPNWGWMGVTPSALDGSTPHQDWMGYPPVTTGWGYPLSHVDGVPASGCGYLLLETEQQSEYLLHGGWYASCVHAGGLSSSCVKFVIVTEKFGTVCYSNF